MRLTRRNALIGIGTVAAGAGVIGGTGAFTSVDADRTVSINTTGDGSANVAITVDPNDQHGSGLSDADDGDNIVSLSLDNLNQNATTVFDGALGITPNRGSAGSYNVSASIEDGDGNSVEMLGVTVSNGSGINVGDQATVDLTINLREYSTSDFPDNTNIIISVSQSS